uniref:Serine hydroxymethyltransferase n=1 Tax=Glossina morsitans morsitans TaxID=37546 RepID=A0A1B0FIS9_GLOMM
MDLGCVNDQNERGDFGLYKLYSGSSANLPVYTGLLQPRDRLIRLDMPDRGGRLTHVDPKTVLIDYDVLEASAKLFKLKLIIAGITYYSRCLDYFRFWEICDQHNASFFADMVHVAGLLATGLIRAPFEYADVVSTTMHKTLLGPRAGVIFFRKSSRKMTPDGNKRGYDVATGGTDIHLFLVDLRNRSITGSQAKYILEEVNIACSENTVPGNKSAMNPCELRFGTPALTTRDFLEDDFEAVAQNIDAAIELANEVKRMSGPKLADFKRIICEDRDKSVKVEELRCEVEKFSEKLPLPGFKEI